MPVSIELKPDRQLLDCNFEGYKLCASDVDNVVVRNINNGELNLLSNVMKNN